MLLTFTIENWMSFRDKQEFSLFAGREKQHGERLYKPLSYIPRVLPIAALYGANASGKSNFLEALSFLQRLVVEGTKLNRDIHVKNFRLDSDYADKESSFTVMMLVEKDIYEYSVSLTRKRIVKERLVHVQARKETVLFNREGGQVKFFETTDHLNVVAKITRDDQLILRSSMEFNAREYAPIYNWFKDKLLIIGPWSRANNIAAIVKGNHVFSEAFNNLLSNLDTHIERLDLQTLDAEQTLIPNEMLSRIAKDIKENETAIFNWFGNQDIAIESHNGEAIARKVVALHPTAQGELIPFEMDEESDGTRRIIDLLPALLKLCHEKGMVVFVDELERSLHHIMVRYFIKHFLSHCTEENANQLVFTTHDALLFTQDIFRRDELWLTDKDHMGASSLKSVAEFKSARYDKVIRKSYLEGRMGGVPLIL